MCSSCQQDASGRGEKMITPRAPLTLPRSSSVCWQRWLWTSMRNLTRSAGCSITSSVHSIILETRHCQLGGLVAGESAVSQLSIFTLLWNTQALLDSPYAAATHLSSRVLRVTVTVLSSQQFRLSSSALSLGCPRPQVLPPVLAPGPAPPQSRTALSSLPRSGSQAHRVAGQLVT